MLFRSLNMPVVKYVPDTTPEKEKKKNKEERTEEKIAYEEDEAWGGSTFSEMKNYGGGRILRGGL